MSDHIRITLLGDLMCQKEQTAAALMRHGKLDYRDGFTSVKGLLAKSDYVIGNLETPITHSLNGLSDQSSRFNTHSSFLDAIQDAGIDFLSIANNHILDRGITGLDETLAELELRKLNHSGAYKTREASEEIFIKEIHGLKVALLSFTYGTNSEYYGLPLDSQETWRVDLLKEQEPRLSQTIRPQQKYLRRFLPMRLKIALSALSGKQQRRFPGYIGDNVSPSRIGSTADEPYLSRAISKIKRAKECADIVIVLPHIGGQYNPSPGKYSKWIMKRIAAAGADAIIANHPHVPLRCERFDEGCFGTYSLGNFCFNPSDGSVVPGQLAEYGMVLHLEFSRTTKSVYRAFFQVVKTVVESDGFATVHHLPDLYAEESDEILREKLMIDNETLVNRFGMGGESVAVENEYEICLGQ